jgi:hypothetical protein
MEGKRKKRRGNAIIEFALSFALLMPLYVWMLVYGLDLKRMMQTNQVSRDAGHMYARGVDFSLPGNQDIIVRLAAGLNLTRTGGSGVVILSRVMKIGPAECTDGGVPLSQCVNLNQPVITQRIVIGNKSLRPSRIGTPPDTMLLPDGSIAPADYLKQSSARAAGFDAILNLNDGELAYVSEAWFESQVKDFPTTNNRGPVYARTIF